MTLPDVSIRALMFNEREPASFRLNRRRAPIRHKKEGFPIDSSTAAQKNVPGTTKKLMMLKAVITHTLWCRIPKSADHISIECDNAVRQSNAQKIVEDLVLYNYPKKG